MRPTLVVQILFALSLLPSMSNPAARDLGFDVVTMRNGDIHNGAVAEERFVLQTAYGTVSIPYSQMASLKLGTTKLDGRIHTRLGDVFSGKLRDRSITVLRVLDPPLPLDVSEIAEIQFTPRRTRYLARVGRDMVEMQNGDRFFGRILTSDFLLNAVEGGILMTSRDDIHYLDIEASSDGSGQMTQITFNNGSLVQGKSMISGITVTNRYGGDLTVPMSDLTALAFDVSHTPGKAAEFGIRQRLAPAAFLQDRLRDGSPGPAMIALRGGNYIRGDTQGDGDADELPPQELKLRPFAIGIFEVTFEEFDRYCESAQREKPDDQGWGRGLRPVVNVSWTDAVDFATWLSDQTGESYRLPTDAEWEYAAKGGIQTRFWWGNEPGIAKANCEGCGSLWDGEKTTWVGRFSPNPFGLHDTAGNVFEWVADCWHDHFADAPVDGSALEKPDCGKRVIRGGAWSFPPKEARSANRWRDFPTRRSDDTGFRVVRDLRRKH